MGPIGPILVGDAVVCVYGCMIDFTTSNVAFAPSYKKKNSWVCKKAGCTQEDLLLDLLQERQQIAHNKTVMISQIK